MKDILNYFVVVSYVLFQGVYSNQLNTPFLNDLKEVSNKESNLGIIGGEPTTIEKHPYQLSVTLPYSVLAGVILNKYWVLTTASLLTKHGKNFSLKSTQIRVGSNNTDNGGTTYTVNKTIFNPNFVSDTYSYDLALHKVNKPIKFSKTVKKVKLASKPLKNGQRGIISGWGATSESNGNPFKQISLSGISRKHCKDVYKNKGFVIGESQVCASAKNITEGPYFDFGDPLIVNNKLYALYSYKVFGYPNVLADISSSLSWIEETIKT
uniref:Peptidase S1 domain-containing protein n=1 Tax=Clastoptera arizonana TaxID=38151 RepID=A0A1B6DUZ4_9HEMI